jgi:hypothetical protein
MAKLSRTVLDRLRKLESAEGNDEIVLTLTNGDNVIVKQRDMFRFGSEGIYGHPDNEVERIIKNTVNVYENGSNIVTLLQMVLGEGD